MKIFLAGASGLVGSAFVRAAKRQGHHVIGVVGGFAGLIEGVAQQLRLDLTNETATTRATLDAAPDAIVNCAAVSAPEQCEANPVSSRKMNVELPAALARAAQKLSVPLVHLSSEQVFDGRRVAPYAASDPVTPINLYAEQKLESEQAVHAAAPELATTLRVPLLLGNSATGQRGIHERLLAEWSVGKTPRLFVDEFRQPCSAGNLAEVILEICQRRDIRGLWHWAGTDLVSRLELGRRVADHFGLCETRAPLAPVNRAQLPEVARKRQPSLALAMAPLAAQLKTRPQSLSQQLSELTVPPALQSWYRAQR